ncbi:MAG TPA: TrkA C-terminal domain-containing protein [Vicinamibacterales bacterium]
MEWLGQALRQNPDLAVFLSLALGYAIGLLRVGSFEIGPVLGALIAGLAVGQFGIDVPEALTSLFFLMFVFALGFRTGPEFFQGLRSNALSQVFLSAVLVLSTLGLTWAFAHLLGLDGGGAAGLLAGASSSSTALGTATTATAALRVDPARASELAQHAATAYALTYLLGTVLVIWFLPVVGPRLMHVDLREECRKMEREMGLQSPKSGLGTSAYQDVATRAYRLSPEFAGKRVADLEALWPTGERAIVERLRRGDHVIDCTPDTVLEVGDTIAIGGHAHALLHESRPFLQEVDDEALLNVPIVSADVVLTNRKVAGHPLKALAERVAARDIFLLKLRRAGRELPFAPETQMERGDILTVTGRENEVARVARRIGYAEYSTSATDLLLVGAAIAIGGLMGIPALKVGHIEIGLSIPVGVLLAGLVVGHFRLIYPRFGRVPDASVWLFESLGLTAFLAAVGIDAGPALAGAFKVFGWPLFAAGAIVTLAPPFVTILVGRYLTRTHPGILLGVCAGACTSAPALAELEKRAESKIPTLGYGLACAIGNVLFAVCGTLLVLFGRH